MQAKVSGDVKYLATIHGSALLSTWENLFGQHSGPTPLGLLTSLDITMGAVMTFTHNKKLSCLMMGYSWAQGERNNHISSFMLSLVLHSFGFQIYGLATWAVASP